MADDKASLAGPAPQGESGKRCRECDQTKDRSEFYHCKTTRDRLHSTCKACFSKKCKERYENNKKEINEKNRRYHHRNRAKLLPEMRARYQENKERHREQGILYREKKKRKIKADKAAYQQTQKWKGYKRRYYRKNIDAIKAKSRARHIAKFEQVKENKRIYVERIGPIATVRRGRWLDRGGRELKRLSNLRRKAKKRALPDTFCMKEARLSIKQFDNKCAVCNTPFGLIADLHWDHWIPLSDAACPGTILGNMVPLCATCNLSKHDDQPKKWLLGKYPQPDAHSIFKRIVSLLEKQGTNGTHQHAGGRGPRKGRNGSA